MMAQEVVIRPGKKIRFNLRSGVLSGSEYVSKGYGFKGIDGSIGDLIIQVFVTVPAVNDPDIKIELESIYAKINNLSK